MMERRRDPVRELERYQQEQLNSRVHRVFQERLFAVKKHDATRLHYDLRMEWNGTLLSWAIPQGPSYCVESFRDAIEMDDHRRENLGFEGLHPTGLIMLWDCGTWQQLPGCEDIANSLRSGVLRFILRGQKLNGGWILERTSSINPGLRPLWVLSKLPDAFARRIHDKCILEEMPNSINGKTMEQIYEDWTHPKRHEGQTSLFEM